MKTHLCIWLSLLFWIKFSGTSKASTKEIEMIDMTEQVHIAKNMLPIGKAFTVELYPVAHTLGVGLAFSKNEEIDPFCRIRVISPERYLEMEKWENPIRIADQVMEIEGLSTKWIAQSYVHVWVANALAKKGSVAMTLQHMEEDTSEESEEE